MSTRHFETGQRELQLGHLDTAKTEFNRALEVLLESPLGARSEPRIREHFDRLVERISAYEVTALAQGDGFTERKLDPASIDDLLAISTFENPVATPETQQAVVDDLQETLHDIDIPLNARVLAFVQLFTGRLKGYLEEGLSRGARYLPMVQEVFRAEGLPLDLAYVPLIESAFKPSALSRAKARGIWQFMRGTGLEMGLKHDWYIDERADAEKSTRAAAKYLKTLHRMFGDWHLALASYNGGPGRVQRAIKRSGKDDFWALSASSRFLPRETRDYVPLILAAVIIAKNPAQYGMNIIPWEEPEFESVQVAKAVDIRRVAEWTSTPVQTIQELNPELRRWTTPVRATDYELKVPMGTADVIRERLAQADPDRVGVPQSPHGEEGRDAGVDCETAEGEPRRSGGGELPQRPVEGEARRSTHHPAGTHASSCHQHRQSGACSPRPGPPRSCPPETCRSRSRQERPGQADPPGQERGHAFLHREALSDDRLVAEAVEPNPRKRDPGGTAAHDLHEPADGDQLGRLATPKRKGRQE